MKRSDAFFATHAKPFTFALAAVLMTLLCAAGPWAPSTRAQGSRKDDIVLNSRGQPLAGAQVRVCASNATTTSPCTPLASVYSDPALTQALANPFTTDGMGNYNFYAAPGRYVIELSGAGITTRQIRDVIIPNDPSSPTFTSLTTTSGINAFTLSLTGNLTVAGSAAVTGTFTVGGAPVPSVNQANTWTAAQQFNANTVMKGPSPWHDITAFEGAAGTVCFNAEEINGTISSGSSTLTLASAGAFANNCYVGVAGAGPSTALSAPTISAVVFTPATMIVDTNGFTRTSNVVTVKLVGDASLTAGDSITIAGATGCATSVNGTFTVAATQFPGGNGNKFTFNQTAGNETCGGTTANNFSPATIVVNAATTHYDYQVLAMDYRNGLTAPSASVGITNGPPTLAGMEPVTITINGVSGAASYPVYRRTGGAGNYVYIGSALPIPTGYTRTTTTIVDYGQSVAGGQLLLPINVPATVPAGATGQILIAQITAGGGTTSLTLGTAASNTATSQTVYHDNTTAFNSVLTAANADLGSGSNGGSSTIFVPPNICPKFSNVNWSALTGPVNINVAGCLWPVSVVHRTSGTANFIGVGSGSGVGFTGQIDSVIVTGELNPTWFDDLNGGTANLANFSFGPAPAGAHGRSAQTNLYVANNEQATYTNIITGGNGPGSYSPGFFVDGSSGLGGIFGLTLVNPNFNGSTIYPVPSAQFRGVGTTTWLGGRLNGRGVAVDHATVVASAGGWHIDGLTSEGLQDNNVFTVSYTNTQNTGGMFFGGSTLADNIYGKPAIVFYLTSSIGVNGSFSFAGDTSGSTLIGGNCVNTAFLNNVGNYSMGVQGGCTYSTVGSGPLTVQGAAAGNTGLNVLNTTIQAGMATPSVGSLDAHHFFDWRNGGNGIAYASLPASGNGEVARFDGAGAFSGITLESPDTTYGLFSFVSPTHGGGSILYQHATGAKSMIFATDTANNHFVLYSSASGNQAAGSAGFWGDLHIETAGSTGGMNLTSAPTSPRSQVFQDASGTIALTTQLPLAGTTGSIGGSALAAGVCTTGTATVTGATTSMAVAVSPASDPGTGFTWTAWVSSANTVTARVCNVSGASATPTAVAYNVRAIQ